jgi:hypothetical protein
MATKMREPSEKIDDLALKKFLEDESVLSPE